jgi:hypothetical protein
MDLNTLVTHFNNEENIEINEEKEFVVKKIYDHNKKIELVKKINKIKKKEYLINIFKIILLHSKDFTENNNGVFVFFHNLSDEAYGDIENYVNKIYKMHKKTSSNILNIYNSDLSDSQNFLSDTISIDVDNDKNLSNKEKLIMRRKKYEKYLDQNQEK